MLSLITVSKYEEGLEHDEAIAQIKSSNDFQLYTWHSAQKTQILERFRFHAGFRASFWCSE